MTTIRNVIPYAPNGMSTVGIDAERLRASIAKLISSSTNELEKLIAELEALKARRRTEEMTRTKLSVRRRLLRSLSVADHCSQTHQAGC
jgi:siroheme synthase (precorrin-2 oxidase/ferrochelatase)